MTAEVRIDHSCGHLLDRLAQYLIGDVDSSAPALESPGLEDATLQLCTISLGDIDTQ